MIKYSNDYLVLAEKPYTSIQGEGRFVGIPMTYVRLQGCNVSCSWCDSQYTWYPHAQEKIPMMLENNPMETSFEELDKILIQEGCKHVWFTGGEPMLQARAIVNYLEAYRNHTKEYHICTAGTIFNRRIFQLMDHVTIDVKAPFSKTKSDMEVIKKVDEICVGELELKMVIAPTVSDMQFAIDMVHKYPDKSWTFQPLYVSETELKLDPTLKADSSYWTMKSFAEWINMTFRHYKKVRMGTQLHKIIWPDKTRLI